MKAEYSSRDPTLSIIASYDGEYNDVGFTISAFSCSPLTWRAQPAKMLFYESVSTRGIIFDSAFNRCFADSRNIHDEECGGQSHAAHIHAQSSVSPTYISRAIQENERARTKGHSMCHRQRRPTHRLQCFHSVVQRPKNHGVRRLHRIYSSAKETFRMVESDTVASSGPYKYGYASLTGQLTRMINLLTYQDVVVDNHYSW